MKPSRITIRTRIVLAALAVASAPVLAAFLLTAAGEPPALAAFVAVALALAGAAWLAESIGRPLGRLIAGLSSTPGQSPSVPACGNWQELTAMLSATLHESRRRITAAEADLAQRSAVLATMVDGVILVDERCVIQLVNPAAATMFGLDAEQARGEAVIEATVNAPLDEALRTALATRRLGAVDLDVLLPEPRRIRALISVVGGGNQSGGAVAVLHDLTSTMQVEQVRRDFVANVSHEIRTPVAGIQMMADNLLHGALDDPAVARSFLRHIHQSASRLVALVDDLLSLARAESGTPTETVPVLLAPLVRTVVADMDPQITSKGLAVSVEVPEDLCVLGDPESVRQVLANLVDNAVKYTTEGSVDVRGGTEDGRAVIEVRDTGIGIPREDLGRVFERFYRVDRARSGDAEGTGLGLSIVKHLVSEMGGTVSVTSEPGHGSTFTVTLPAAAHPHLRAS